MDSFAILSSVVGPGIGNQGEAYSKKVPPSFDGHTSYDVYKADVETLVTLYINNGYEARCCLHRETLR